MTRIAFLWHHHQPDYRHPETGRPIMPWVRLHALRGYRDLGVAIHESGCPMTVNLVPSLLDQLAWYEKGGDDPHLELTRRPAEDLSAAERARVLSGFVAGHPGMFSAHPASARLRSMRDAGTLRSTRDLRDLQVWSTLSWVGWSGRRDAPELEALRQKGQGFSEDDKSVLLQACARLLADVLPLYRRLAQGPGELSASAYYHPILPLVIDLRSARRNLPHLQHLALPSFAYPGDAALQLSRGRARVEQAVGAPVRGLWPSEGSVSPELLPLAAEAGFRWLVSDEEVLRRSQHSPGTPGGPWDLGHGIQGFFRDRAISDAIGFRFAQLPATEAVEALVGMARGRQGLVTVALDGENPWEAWPDAGRDFMQRLMRRLTAGKGVQATTLSEAAQERPVGTVRHLHTGSWINANFQIWAGDEEDRVAWRQLSEARAAVAKAGDPPAALEPLLAAEGSDWFWWYGEQFSTPFALEFDRLFRAQLTAAWRSLGLEPPEALAIPIKTDAPASPAQSAPTRALSPPMDAKIEAYFDWAGAGELRCAVAGGVMAHGLSHLDSILWGRQGGRLLVRLRHARPLPVESPDTRWVLVLDLGGKPRSLSWPYGAVGEPLPGLCASAECTDIAVEAEPELRFHLALIRAGGEIARYPHDGSIQVSPAPQDWWV